MKKKIFLFVSMLIFMFALGNALAQSIQWEQTCYQPNRIEITDVVDSNGVGNLVKCVIVAVTNTPMSTLTSTPTSTSTNLPPTATNIPLPSPTSPPDISCGLGTVFAETHSWWQETTDNVPRHSHVAACMPVPGSALNGTFEVRVRYITFAAPNANIDRIRWRWDTNYTETQQVSLDCPGSTDWDEEVLIGEQLQCTKYVTFLVDPDKRATTPDDLRFEQLLSHTDLTTESRVGITSELGQGGKILRARGWYTDLDYVTVNWLNIANFIPAGSNQPVLSGQVLIPVEFRNCDGIEQSSALFINPPFHQLHGNGQGHEHIVPIWSADTCTKDGVLVDTTQLANGEHLFYFQGTETDDRGEHSVALAIPVIINN